MRLLIVAVALVSALAFASGAFAQTAPQSPPPPTTGPGTDATRQEHPGWFTEPFASGAFAQTAPQSPPPPTTGTDTDATRQEHPGWVTETNTYKPFPASGGFAEGR